MNKNNGLLDRGGARHPGVREPPGGQVGGWRRHNPRLGHTAAQSRFSWPVDWRKS